MRTAFVAVAALLLTAAGTSARGLDGSQPLVGGDYYQTSCNGGREDLLKGSPDPVLERDQLFAMHASGLNSLRLTINYTSDPSLANGGHGGALVVPTGALVEPYRSLLVRYLTDARAAGFTDITIAFYPYGPNSPLPWTTGEYVDDWNPALYAADWRFVQDVRAVTKDYGPAESHFDLMAEGPSSDYDRTQIGTRGDQYVAKLYTDYVNAYGAEDVFFTVIDKIPAGDDSRLSGLIDTLRSTGKPLPHWWGLDIEYTGAVAARNLADADATLRAAGVDGSFALGETAYESGGVAAAVQRFEAATRRQVVQIEEYPNLGEPDCVSAPFTGDAYLKVQSIEPGPLRASVDSAGRPRFTTADGVPVKALKLGTYTVVVTDRSRRGGFRLSASGYHLQTSKAFRGSVTWKVDLSRGGPGRWTYASTGRRRHVVGFDVLS
jgi:hypothetical protein